MVNHLSSLLVQKSDCCLHWLIVTLSYLIFCGSVRKPQNFLYPAFFYHADIFELSLLYLYKKQQPAFLLLSRIENVTDAVTKHVEDNYADHDRNTWVDHQPWCFCHVSSSLVQHQSPFRCGRCSTKAKEG